MIKIKVIHSFTHDDSMLGNPRVKNYIVKNYIPRKEESDNYKSDSFLCKINVYS